MKRKILEIGPYPPPNSGWSVRIKFLKEALVSEGHDCQVLNLGQYRKIKSPEYIDVQSGLDYLMKLVLLRLKGYNFHVHMNAQAVKGPILSLLALLGSLLTFSRAVLTFHGGIEQLYFPRRNGKKMYGIVYLNFLLSKLIICNNDQIKKEIWQFGPFINRSKIHPVQAFSVQYLNYQEVELPVEIENFLKAKKHIILCYIVLRKGFFIETLVDFIRRVRSEVGIILTGIRSIEDEEITDVAEQLKELEQRGLILMVEDLDHDEFMTLLNKSDIYLRTPISDGVTSSVLEALSLKVPVVASENGRRPEGVITYKAGDVDDLENKVSYVLGNIDEIKRSIYSPPIRDTVLEEVELLVS